MSRVETGVELARLGLLAALAGGCQSVDNTLTTPVSSRATFTIANSLIAPITVAVDGLTYAIIPGSSSLTLTMPPNAQWLTWTSAKPKDAEGNRIPDDIGEVRVAVAGINRELDIRNVIDDQPYFTARIHNDTTEPVSIGVFNGQSVSCAGDLPAAANGVTGFVLIGYYRLLLTTEVRAFRDPGCSGPYIAWPQSALSVAEPNSGVVSLILEDAP